MSAIDKQLTDNQPENMDIDKLLDNLDLNGVPFNDTVSLIRQRQSLTMTIFNEAWKSAGRTLDNPGEVEAYWFDDHDLLLVDLSTDE